jgi:two-component system chemotaxis response regulator CheY
VSGAPRTVLLVDDSTTVLRLLEWVLRPTGLRLLACEGGAAALETVASNRVDLAVVDLNMPGMDGLELVRALRARKETSDLPIIMLTTERREEDVLRAYDAGVNAYLVKPSTAPVIRYKVLSLLGLPAGPVPGEESP